MNEKIVAILEEFAPGEDVANCETLVTDRVLDSLTIVALVSELEDQFDITLPAVEIVEENFNSAQALSALVERLVADQLG